MILEAVTATNTTTSIPWDTILKVAGFVITPIVTFALGRISHKKDRKEVKADKQCEQLKSENAELKKRLELYEEVEQSKTGNFLIMKKTGQAICPVCWAKDHTPVPIYDNGSGNYLCGGCGKGNVYDHVKDRAHTDAISRQNKQLIDYANYNADF